MAGVKSGCYVHLTNGALFNILIYMNEKTEDRCDDALFNVIMSRVASGESISRICRDENMPAKSVVFGWIYDSPTRLEQYTRATSFRADSRVDRIDDYGDMLLNHEITSDVARVLIDKERWQAGKENKKYSDKTQIELTGKDGEPLSMRLIEAQQRLLKDITPQQKIIEHIAPIVLDDLI